MPEDTRTESTRRRLVEATMETIRTQGIAKVSARTIAAAGDVNQALVFYHFGTVDSLVAHACVTSTRERVENFRPRFEAVPSFAGLVALGREIHDEEAALGNVTVLAQTLAGSQANPALAAATGESLGLWRTEIERTLTRLLAGSPFDELVAPGLLADVVTSAFIGLELMVPTREGENVPSTIEALDRLEDLARSIDGLGPVARRALRGALRRV
ncbi:TetR/AcrR family transcriptional regulator [Lapillicoccus jejuensis]|uniref:TetR family transcriptional regulator n=1 Tax=Lapillicoccus jejuensis TaxID=402171 RepID=A0A542DXE8_9MICO|nr:TetR/AcrR family transcriptional regulator [Lapillicoccus jejuensis]TQJ07594.1 TetR family transcriptional regulator [Lapillicoccus jejuensis]